MPDPNGWEVTAVVLTHLEDDGQYRARGFRAIAGISQSFRAHFEVSNGSGPTTTGWLHFEVRIAGGAWFEFGDAKFVNPGMWVYDPDLDLVVYVPGDNADAANITTQAPGSLLEFRLRVEWVDGDHVSMTLFAPVPLENVVGAGRNQDQVDLPALAGGVGASGTLGVAAIGDVAGTATLAERASVVDLPSLSGVVAVEEVS